MPKDFTIEHHDVTVTIDKEEGVFLLTYPERNQKFNIRYFSSFANLVAAATVDAFGLTEKFDLLIAYSAMLSSIEHIPEENKVIVQMKNTPAVRWEEVSDDLLESFSRDIAIGL